MTKEKYRPKYHFTPMSGFMNDPNGLVYEKSTGLYHMCYQYQVDVKGDNCHHWGHSVSKDLIHWKDLKCAIPPQKDLIIASGSTVVDDDNDSGLFSKNDSAKFISFYTKHIKETGNQSQAMAYSKDGLEWINYNNGQAIISNENFQWTNDFRDPNVIKIKDKEKDVWLMFVGGGEVRIFSSNNLIDWSYESTIQNVKKCDDEVISNLKTLQKYLPNNDPDGKNLITECPDVFELFCNGLTKYVIICASLFYLVGDIVRIDGKYHFAPITSRKKYYSNTNFFSHFGEAYAGQSFYGLPNNRNIQMNWLMDTSSFSHPDKSWNGAMSLPIENNLKYVDNDYFLIRRIAQEVFNLRKEKIVDFSNSKYAEISNVDLTYSNISFRAKKLNYLEMTICEDKSKENKKERKIVLKYVDNLLFVDFRESCEELKDTVFKTPLSKLSAFEMFFDNSIIDLSINDGEFIYSTFLFACDFNKVKYETDSITTLNIYSMDV